MKKVVNFSAEITPWEAWIMRIDKNHNIIANNYDKMCSLAAYQYSLGVRSQKIEHQDRITFLCRWWFKNKRFMRQYKTYAAIGSIIGNKDHATVMHHIHVRKVSYSYEDNTACIKDFLES